MSQQYEKGYEETDELGNHWIYNPETGFLEYSSFESSCLEKKSADNNS